MVKTETHKPRTYGRNKTPEDPSRCIEGVYDQLLPIWRQCYRKRTVGLYCKQHDPDALKARAAERAGKRTVVRWSSLTNDPSPRVVSQHPEFVAALLSIANGAANPAQIARAVLERHGLI